MTYTEEFISTCQYMTETGDDYGTPWNPTQLTLAMEEAAATAAAAGRGASDAGHEGSGGDVLAQVRLPLRRVRGSARHSAEANPRVEAP